MEITQFDRLQQANLARLENQVDAQCERTIQHFQALSEAQLTSAPTEGGWSVADCLWHLNSYSEYYLPAIRKAIQQAGNDRFTTFSPSWFGAWFTKMMQPGKGRFKAMTKHRPPAHLSGAEEVARFLQHQEELLDLLRQSDRLNLNTIKVPISIAAWFKLPLGDVFEFLIAHQERHLQQAERVISAQLP